MALSSWLQDLFPSFIKTISEKIPTALSSSLGLIVDAFLGMIFSVYILAHKENFILQTKRFLRVWLPEKINYKLIHIASVCSASFRNFIVGQTTEAIILGTLCTIGMAILQQIEGNIIYPKVVGNRINLPSFWVLAALTIGGNLAGPLGMILGVPVCSAIYNLVSEATDLREQKQLNKITTEKTEEIRNE